jgi:hypothetical protein
MFPQCPKHFQDRITRAGGTNRYGEPHFKLVWSQSETRRAGGMWPSDGYVGYREVYVANGSPFRPSNGYWMLMEWNSPEQYNGEALYFYLHRNEYNGLCTLGPYPYRGRYEIAAKLIWTVLIDNKMIIEPWELTSTVIDRILPTVIAAKKDSFKRRMEFAEAERIQAERKQAADIDAIRNDIKRPLLLPSQIDDRVRLMEKQWSQFLKRKPAVTPGLSYKPPV